MYQQNAKIRYSECGAGSTLTLTGLINYFQDCSSAHSELLGVGATYLQDIQRAWVLNTWQVVINRLPNLMEEVEVSTWPTGFKGVFGPRNFCMKTKEGEMLAYANTLWVYLDTQTGRPTKPSIEEQEIYGVEPALDMEHAPRKIRLPQESAVVDTILVRKYHIDTNQHMNNSKYIEVALESVPKDFAIRELRVEYKKSAVLGDMILVKRGLEEDRVVLQLCDEDEQIYAVVELIGEQ